MKGSAGRDAGCITSQSFLNAFPVVWTAITEFAG
ncbi:hypothetical protein jaqu_00060 [Jannaschia aquimarina]|uniref:Uncharacterized protein n=1 Tax=Jannaschia aquimarina TaxID=935700 RepID=A0A0D1EMJ8_9RHOB|nr:hypothetical protein jaqu_00060 [Jannaschia aquimarina]SNS83445.1 hypothetical protein SAMN05421775_102493 [Jannaschia aquimarina]